MDLHKLEMETLFAEVFNLVKLTDREDHSENDDSANARSGTPGMRPVGEEICDPGPGGRGDLKMVHTYDIAL